MVKEAIKNVVIDHIGVYDGGAINKSSKSKDNI
mgnify:CR=1 FL=1